MLPRPKLLRVSLIVVPLVLVALLWSALRGRPRFVATPVSVQSLALSHDGKRLAFTIQNDEVFWGQDERYHRLPLEYKSGFGVKSTAKIQFSRDEDVLLGARVRLLANKTPAACKWDLRTNRLVWSVTSAKNTSGGFSLTPDGKKLAQLAGSVVTVTDITQQGTAREGSKSRYERAFPILFRQQLRVVESQGSYGNTISHVAISENGATLVAAETTGILQLWDVKTAKLIAKSPRYEKTAYYEYNQLKFSPDGRFVAAGDEGGIALWNTVTKVWTRSAVTSQGEHELVWMPDSRSLWTSGFVAPNSDADKLQRLSVPDLKPLQVLPGWGPFAVSGDGKTLAMRADAIQKGVWLWNIE